VKLAIIQFNIRPGDIAANEAKVAALVQQAAAKGAQAVVLPELWNCGYALKDLVTLAQSSRGTSINLLKKLAKKYGLFVFGGSIAELKDGRYYNTQIIINAEGSVISKYRKIHLFSLGLQEDEYFTPGQEWVLSDTPWGQAGLMLCYDLRFPELARNLALRGAKLLVVPAQWPAARLAHWQILAQARALENQVFVIAVNRFGEDTSGVYNGHSLVVSPWGDILLDAVQEELSLVDIDMSLVDEARSKLPVLEERRRILDEIDDSQL